MSFTKKCPICGNDMESVSIGWVCRPCDVFVGMDGKLHNRTHEPFMLPMTNADKINAMSIEEKVKFFVDVRRFMGCPPCNPKFCTYKCDRCWEDYLKKKVED